MACLPSPKKGRIQGARGGEGKAGNVARDSERGDKKQGRKHKKGGTLGQKGVCMGQGRHVSTELSCQLTLLRSSPSTRDKLTFSATLNLSGSTPSRSPPPTPSQIGGGGSFTLTLLVGLVERAMDTAQIRSRGGQEK